MDTPKIDAHRQLILGHALPNVPFEGWTRAVMTRAAREAGIPDSRLRLAFPEGPLGLVAYFIARADRQMTEKLGAQDLSSMKIREKVTFAVRTWLELQADNPEAVRRAATLLSLPLSAGTALRCLYGTVDALWLAIGDTSTDYNFYTKRMILAGVFSTVLLQWLGDDSDGKQDTWDFLDRRIANVMSFEKFKARLPDASGLASAPFRFLGALRYPGIGRSSRP